jgi:hypothetical protein
MEQNYSSRLPGRLARPLAALGLLLATAGAAQAQSFGPMATYSTGGSNNLFVATGDLNSDGVPDLVSTNANSSNVSVLLGQAAGGFAAAVTYASGSSPREVVLADVNRDGRLDVVLVSSTGVNVLLGTGTGTLGTASAYSTGSTSGFSVKLYDVTRDGILDAVTANSSTTASVLPGRTAGTFGAATTYTVGSSVQGVSVADFNRDGFADLALSDGFQTNVYVLLGRASGFAAPVTYPVGQSSKFIETADLNRDGQLDIIVSGDFANSIKVLTGNANGTFNAEVAYPVMASSDFLSGLTVGDVNGDGYPDVLVAAARQNTVYVLPGSSAGTLGAAVALGVGAFVYDITLADINRDGRPDLVVANSSDANVGVLLNTTVLAAPTLAAINPARGPAGTSVTLTGQSLNGATAVTFNNTAQATITNQSANSLTVTVPAGATSGNVTVTTPLGTSNGVAFAVQTDSPTLTSPAPNASGQPTFAGAAPAGSTVTIYLALNGGAAQAIGTTTATGGSFSLVPATALGTGSYTAYATAQLSGQAESVNSAVTPFTVGFVATLSSPAGASGSATGIFPYPFTVTFSEPVTGFSASGISVSNGYVSSGPTGSGTTYTFAVTPSAPGATTVSLNAGAAQNAAGSPSPASNAYSLTYSLPLPPLPVLLTPADGSLISGRFVINGRATAGSIVGVTITDIYTRTNRFFSTTAGSNGSFIITSVLGTGLPSSVYQISATASLNGQQSTSNINTFTVDATGPTVTISSAAGSSTNTAPIPFTISFSEPIQSLAASSVRVTNGAITSAITNVGNDYSFSVTPTAGGIVTVTLPTGAVQDQFGNNNSSTSALSVTYVVPITATAWTGAVSTDWFDASNWTQGVPTATVDATISPVSSGRYPLVAAGTAAARNLNLNSGTSLTMSGGTLDVRATLANNSTFVATGGTVVLGTSTQGAIVGSSPTNFWSLQVERSGALLATSVGAAVRQVLTLNGNFDTNGNVFTLRSTAAATALVVNNGGVVSGTATVQRAIDPSLNPGLGYRHYSAPVSNSTVADLATSSFTPTVNPAYNTASIPSSVSPYPTVFGYDDSRLATTATSNNLSSFDKGYFSPSALPDPLAVGRGYTVNLSARELVDFEGTLNNGDLTLPLTSTRNTYPDGGWQLLGNPYPAPLDYARVAPADRAGLEAAIYVYASTSQYAGRYRTYVNGIGNPVLPVAQGFFARVASGQPSATMTFRNSQRLTAPDPTAFQRPAAPTADPRPLVQLELRAGANAAAADEFFAYAEAGATPAFDAAFDAQKLPNPTGFNLSSLAASGQPLAVDARAAFTAATVLPLSLGVPAPGSYALSAAAITNLPAGLDAYLADDLTGQLTRLAAGTNYAFSVSASQAATAIVGRFRLLFRPATALATAAPGLSAADVAVFPNPARARFTVVLPGLGQASTVQAELRNALGQVLRRQTAALPASGTQLSFDTAELATGVYVLRLQAGTTNLAKRVVIE